MRSESGHLIVQSPAIETPTLKALARMTGTDKIIAVPTADHQCFRLGPLRNRIAVTDDVVRFCATHAVDFGFVADEQRLDSVGLVAMDMDSTLITIESIDELADLHGIKSAMAAVTAATMRGEIEFAESLTRRVALLKGLPASALQRVYDERLRLSPGAERLLARLRRAGAKTMLVSGGFTFFTDLLRARLGLDYTCANTLEIVDGRLTGRLVGPIVDAQAKADYAARIGAALPDARNSIVAIGDGANDLKMFARAKISIAYHAKPVVRASATYAIDYCGLDAAVNLFVS